MDALCASANLRNAVDPDADHGSVVGHKKNIFFRTDNFHRSDRSGLFIQFVAGYTGTAAALVTVLFQCGPLAEALLRDAEERFAFGAAASPDNIILTAEPDTPHAHRCAAHYPDILFRNQNCPSVMRCNDDPFFSLCREHGNEFIPFIKADGTDAVRTQIFQCRLTDAFDGAVAGDKEEILILLIAPAANHGTDFLVLLSQFNGQYVHDVGASG